jgi:DNA-binding GntR family transcriptional regulator
MATKSPANRIEPKRRAADLAYDRIEALISTLQIAPGSTVVESEIVELTQLGRTPVREALMRMAAIDLIVQQPRRGLSVSSIDVVDHLDLIETRRALERLIAASSARGANAEQRKELVRCAEKMIKAGAAGNLYQAEGEISEGARFHMLLAEAIASGDAAQAADGAGQLMDYLERFARKVINV